MTCEDACVEWLRLLKLVKFFLVLSEIFRVAVRWMATLSREEERNLIVYKALDMLKFGVLVELFIYVCSRRYEEFRVFFIHQ